MSTWGGDFPLFQKFDFSFISQEQVMIIVLSFATGDHLTSFTLTQRSQV